MPGYPAGALYLDLKQQSGDISQHLRMFLEQLGRRPNLLPPDAHLPSEFVKATNKKHIIVFLDNVTDYERVRDLIPRSPSCLVILTSLERLTPDIKPLPLKPLEAEHAAELFSAFAPSRGDRDAPADQLLTKVLEACAGLPIAIRPLAARLEDNPGYTLARALDALNTYQHESVLGSDLDACFRLSYDALAEVQMMLFRRLSVVPGESFDIAVAAHLGGGLPLEQARQALEKLRARQLIQPTKDEDYFTMHSLLRQFAGKLLGTDASEQTSSLLDFYCRESERNDQIIRSLVPVSKRRRQEAGNRAEQISKDRDNALAWMEKQHRNLVAAVKLACEQGLADLAWRISRALVEFFEIRGEWESWEQTHKEAQPDSLGDVYRYMRNWNAAENCFTRSLEDQHDERWIAATRLSLADIYLDSELGEPRGLLEHCLTVFEMFGDTHWLLLTQRSLGEACRKDRDFDGAMAHLLRCQVSLERSHDVQWEGEVLHSIGRVHLDTGGGPGTQGL